MMNSFFELFLTFGLGILLSGFAFLCARRSLTLNDDLDFPKEDYKIKSKISKQPVKNKANKKDSTAAVKQKNNKKTEQKSNVNVTRNNETLKETTENLVTAVERNKNDSTTEWTKVIKPTKKPKRESKQDSVELSSPQEESVKITTTENNQKEAVKSSDRPKVENQIKIESAKVLQTEKVPEKPVEPAKNQAQKSKKFVTLEEEPKPKDTKPETQTKSTPVSNETDGLQQKLAEMMMELDKMKNNQKDDSKPNNQVNKELESMKLKLKTSQTNEQKLLEDVKKKGQAVSDLKNQFLIIQSELTKNIVANQSINRDKLNLENRFRSVEDQNVLLNEKCQHFEKLKSEYEELEKKFNAIEQELKSVKHECSDIIKSQEREMLTQINVLQSEKHRMQDQLVRVQNDLIGNNNKMQTVQQDLLTAKSAHNDLLGENLRLQKKCVEMEQLAVLKQQEFTDFDNKLKQNEEQITCLKKQINDLNTMNINLSVLKSDLEKQVDQLHNSQSISNSQEIMELTEKVQILTQQLTDTKAELTICQLKLEELDSSCVQHMTQLHNLTTEKDNLVALVDQYKTGLESTESILSKLQTSVNEEESKWRESLIKSENEVEKSKKELEIVYNDLMRIRNSRTDNNELNFAYHCVDKSLSSLIDEMEARMIHFEKSLETVVQERDTALSQVSSQINGLTTNHEAINGDDHSLYNEDCEKLRTELGHQVELNKTLDNQCNKYKSLIDIGKDALDSEKSRVRELEQELLSLQSLTTTVSINNIE